MSEAQDAQCQYKTAAAETQTGQTTIFTITMMPPDYEADFGEEFHTIEVEANTPEQAVAQARETLAARPGNEADADDFQLVTVFHGRPVLVRSHLDNL